MKKIKKLHPYWMEDAQNRLDDDSVLDVTYNQWVLLHRLAERMNAIIDMVNDQNRKIERLLRDQEE